MSVKALGIPAQSSEIVEGQPVAAPSTAPWEVYTSRQQWSFLAILLLLTITNYFDYFLLSVLIEPIEPIEPIEAEFKVSDTQMGLLSGACFAIVCAMASLPLARWADRGNRRSIIALALVAWSLMTVMCGAAQSFCVLALARFGAGATGPELYPPRSRWYPITFRRNDALLRSRFWALEVVQQGGYWVWDSGDICRRRMASG